MFFGGLWLANIFYWGCNQFITQGTLSARNVWHGQMGAVFAGFLKLLVPVLVVLPGIIAYRLYNPASGLLRATFTLDKGDLAFPTLVKQHHCRGAAGARSTWSKWAASCAARLDLDARGARSRGAALCRKSRYSGHSRERHDRRVARPRREVSRRALATVCDNLPRGGHVGRRAGALAAPRNAHPASRDEAALRVPTSPSYIPRCTN